MTKRKRTRKPPQRRAMKDIRAGNAHVEVPEWMWDLALARMPKDPDGVVGAARKGVELFDRGVRTGLYSAVRVGVMLAEAADEAWWAMREDAFDCKADAGDAMEKLVAAPVGTEPLWGQPGRWIVEVLDCRIDLKVEGLFGLGFAECRVIDIDKPFISETGYRSLGSGIEAPRVGDTPTAYWQRNIMRCISTDHNGRPLKKGPTLHRVEGYQVWLGQKRVYRPYQHDENDAAWQPGGFYYERVGAPPVTVVQEASGQLALEF